MTIPDNTPDYFYTSPDLIRDGMAAIKGEEFAHLVHVMRKKTGDGIRVVDGKGTAYDVVLDDLKNKTAYGTIVKILPNHHEPAVDVFVAAGILKNPSRFDFLVEKIVELGVAGIYPMTTQRTIPNHARSDRWQKLSLAAMKQSCRSRLPHVHTLCSLPEILTHAAEFDLRIIAHGGFAVSEHSGIAGAGHLKKVLILIGPEGGFTEEEVARCLDGGFRPLSLGIRRLRTETAAIAAMTLIGNTLFGHFTEI